LVLKADFQTTLQVFIFSNLPMLMNSANATNVVVTTDIVPTTPISTDTTPVIIIPPDVLQALQSYTLNNFPNIGLPQDIQQLAQQFISNLPPLIPITPTTSSTATPATTVTTTTS